MRTNPRTFAADRVLRDGGSIHVRAIRPDDKARLLDHFNRLGARSVYFRFFRVKKRLNDDELRQFTELDFDRNVGLVATLQREGGEEIVGVGRYARLDSPPGEPRRAEVAFAVADAHQGRGVATVLLEHLAAVARAAGIEEFEADVLGENNSMMSVFAQSGFAVRRSIADGIFHVRFPTEETEQSVAAELRRDRAAAAASVRVFLQPRSVAVVGASSRPGSIGAALIGNVRRCGFTGAIYPVHPHAATIEELQAFPTVSAIGAKVDLAIIAVPAAGVEAVVADCARAGVRGVVVISSGFAEVSDGAARQRQLTELVRASGMRMVGPNCMGVLNTDPAVSFNGTFAPHWPAAGNVAMLSQSGALGLAILERFERLGLGLANFVSVGNKADVSSNDLLAYWADDPRSAVILLYLESFGNPRKFARVAPEVARRKPIVAVKAGRSAAGRRAAASHSAALANLDVAVDALFEQAGVIRTETLEELFDVAGLLATQPVPPGSAVGVVTNAGGLGILLADACEANGLMLPALSAATRDALRAVLSPAAGLANPVDVTAPAAAADYERAIELIGADAAIDAVVAVYITPLVTRPEEVAAAIARSAGTVPAHKPVLTVFMHGAGAPAALHGGPRGRLPVYEFPENAARALAAAARAGRPSSWPILPPRRSAPSSTGCSPPRADRSGCRPRTSPPCSARPGSTARWRRRSRPAMRWPPRSAWATRWWPKRSRPLWSTRAIAAGSFSVCARRTMSPRPSHGCASASRSSSRFSCSGRSKAASRRWSASPPTRSSVRSSCAEWAAYWSSCCATRPTACRPSPTSMPPR